MHDKQNVLRAQTHSFNNKGNNVSAAVILCYTFILHFMLQQFIPTLV